MFKSRINGSIDIRRIGCKCVYMVLGHERGHRELVMPDLLRYIII